MLDAIFQYLQGQREAVIDLQSKLTSIPALGPDNNGDGEKEKCEFVRDYLTGLGITDLREFNAPDERVSCGYRPNLAAVISGKDTSKTLWVIAHLDVVPPGDPALWIGDPYEVRIEGDLVYGRGVEDNQQAMVSALLLAAAIKDLKITPAVNFGMLFVADEETGNTFGLDYLAENHPELFGENDLILIPDSGVEDGSKIEVAEKSIVWLKVTVLGQQCHASDPRQGNNSLIAASDFILRTRRLYDKFDRQENLFDPPYSTFEATKKEANVENVNTLPGRDVFHLDCRVLPNYPLDDVVAEVGAIGKEIEELYGVETVIEEAMRDESPAPTPVESEIVRKLSDGIRKVRNVEPEPYGIGGGTVAKILRAKGLCAAVWATLMHKAHQPNECSSIANTIDDAKVMATMILE